MTSKYTPTPWVALKDGRVRDDSGETIAAMYGDVRAADENALLFAAAPDLLAACERLAEAQRRADAGEHGGFGLYVDAVDAARAAIGKARGEKS